MIMIVSDVLTRYAIVSALLLKDGNKELNSALKVKIMKMRMEYKKVRKQFDDDVQEFLNELPTTKLRELQAKPNKTEEEAQELIELGNKINSEYMTFITERSKDEVNCTNYTLTEEEYFEILDVNSGNDTVINEKEIKAADLLETLGDLFLV